MVYGGAALKFLHTHLNIAWQMLTINVSIQTHFLAFAAVLKH